PRTTATSPLASAGGRGTSPGTGSATLPSGRGAPGSRGGGARGGPGALRAASRVQSTVFFTPFNDAVERQSPYGLLELSAELGPRQFTISAYARNLTDERYITGSSGSPPPAVFGGRPAEPREWGVRLAVRLPNKQP